MTSKNQVLPQNETSNGKCGSNMKIVNRNRNQTKSKRIRFYLYFAGSKLSQKYPNDFQHSFLIPCICNVAIRTQNLNRFLRNQTLSFLPRLISLDGISFLVREWLLHAFTTKL